MIDGLLLVWARLEGLPAGEIDLDRAIPHARTWEDHIPVDRRLRNRGYADAAGGDNLVGQHLLRVGGPAVRGGDDHAATEMLRAVLGLESAARGLEEGIQLPLLKARGREIKLALDRGPGAVIHATGDQVDTGVLFATVVAPIRPAHDFIELRLQRWVGLEVVDHQLLEGDAVLRLRLILAQLGEDL